MRQTNRTLERQSKEKQRIIEDLEEKIKRALEENNELEDGYLELQEQNDLLTSTIEEKNREIADLQKLLRSQRARSVQNDQFSIRVSDSDSNMPELRQQSLTRNAGARSVESNQLTTRVSDSDSSASRGRQQSHIRNLNLNQNSNLKVATEILRRDFCWYLRYGSHLVQLPYRRMKHFRYRRIVLRKHKVKFILF